MRSDILLNTINGNSDGRFVLPRELITTDRILQRWATSIGTGLPSEEWDDQPRSRLPPLSDDVAIDVDQCILSSPPKTKSIITRWYKTPSSAEVIARQLGMSRRNLYNYHSLALNYIRWKFEGCGNDELNRLILSIDN